MVVGMVWLVIAAVVGLRFPRFVAFWLLLDVGWAVLPPVSVTSVHLLNVVLAGALIAWVIVRGVLRRQRARRQRARREWEVAQWRAGSSTGW